VNHRERELKLVLAEKGDHTRLCAALVGFEEEVVQTNLYFDEQRILADQGMMLRLRLESIRSLLTLKIKKSSDRGIFDSEEIEQEIEQSLARDIEGGRHQVGSLDAIPLVQARSMCGNPLLHLQEWGRVRNTRRVYLVRPDWRIEVDETEFPGAVYRWEVEVECEDEMAVRKYLEETAIDAGVKLHDQTITKAQFLDQILRG